MRGFSGGALAGVAVGAAALAGLSLLAPPGAGPGEMGVVTDAAEPVVAEAPPGQVVPGTGAIPSEAPTAEAAPGADLVVATGGPKVPAASAAAPDAPAPDAPEADAPAVVEEAVVAEPGPSPDEPQVAATVPDEVAPPMGQASLGPASSVEQGGVEPQANGAGEVPALAEPAEGPSAEPPSLQAQAATAEPVPDAPPPEAVVILEPPLGPAALVAPEQGVSMPQVADLGALPTIEAAPAVPLPEAALPEPDLAQTEEPAPVPEDTVAAGQEAPVGPLFQVPPKPEGDAAPLVPGEEPDRPGRVTVGGRSLPGGGPVQVNRPEVEPEPAPEVAEAAAEEAVPEVPGEVEPAVRRFAATWEVPSEVKPLMSLVLIDDGTTDPEAVAALPWPVSVALDPAKEGAAERLAAYRAQGIEALVLAELPQAAQPVDVEVFLGAALDALPETVAVLDLGQGGLGGRDATAQMAMSRVARDGRGLVLGDDGLRSGLDLAGREGVPAAEVLRDLDGEGQDGAAIRRGLDDAVRRAGQEGEAVVIGRVGPETLAALTEWSLEGRAQEVTVAPVSAVLGAE